MCVCVILSVALRKPEFAADVAPLLFPPAISGSGRKTRPASDVHRRTLLGHRRTFSSSWASAMASHAFAYRTGATDAQVRNSTGATFQFVVAPRT